MPELPEVEIVRRALEPVMTGRRLDKLVFNRPNLRFALPMDLPARMEGHKVARVFRRGKYILVFGENGHGFVLHLGMSGVIRIEKDQTARIDEKHDHVEWHLDGGVRVVLNDPRRFGFVEALEEECWQDYPSFAAMGPEPLGNDLSAPVLAAALAARKAPIKAALLDQSIIAGLGNIYVCEALFRARIHPARAARSLSAAECEDLTVEIKRVLRDALEAGGSSLKDYKHTDGKLGYFQHHFAVYGREGEMCSACKCDSVETGGIQRIVQSGRSTFYCAQCQR